MPMFTFRINHGSREPERVEVELPDLRAAWSQAVTACGEALEDMEGDFGMSDEWVMTVSDTERPVFELRCASRNFISPDREASR